MSCRPGERRHRATELLAWRTQLRSDRKEVASGQHLRAPARITARVGVAGQVVVLFALFLLILLGVSAIGIDYATWLLTDRNLQNVSDHAALAGASAFEDASTSNDCGGPKCDLARAQAWTSLRDELKLVDDLGVPLGAPAIADLASGDSPPGGQPDGNYGGQDITFRDTIWVSTPPPPYAAYVAVGGHYAFNPGVVFVRVDRDVPSFIGGALGIRPQPRHGWSTAGVQSTDFAMQIFCSVAHDPSCGGSGQAALVIDGGGGIRLIRGSIASNESLKVTQQGSQGVILESGDMFVVHGDCGSSSWNCPQTPATAGGIADDDPTATPNVANNKNVFYIPPQPVPQFQSPLDLVTVSQTNCNGAGPTDLCVPNRPEGSNQPGDWSCSLTDLNNLCGQPCAYVPAAPLCVDPATLNLGDTGYGTIRCDARVGGAPSRHLVPWGDGSGASGFHESPDQPNGEDFRVLDDDPAVPDPDTTAAANPPTDYVYMNGVLGTSGGGATQSVTYVLRPPFGIPQVNSTIVRYVAFKTDGSSALSDTGNVISVSAVLLQSGSPVPGGSEPSDAHTLSGTPTLFEFTVPAGQITNYTALSIRFTFHTVSGDNSNRRGGGIAWTEAETPTLDPAIPPMIPPGSYHSITIPGNNTAHGCAIMDPTAVYTGLKAYQLPGIYRFGGPGGASLTLGEGSYLIGDGVTLVFDPSFPDATGSAGIVLGVDSGLVLNTALTPNVAGATPCSPYAETGDYNPSAPLIQLPYSALCASWGVDTSATSGVRVGANAWSFCDPVATGGDLTLCRDRTQYNPTVDYRGITFYLTPPAWNPSTIRNRFEMQGTDAGLSFRGVLYAPYDDVKISGRNGFNTVGQVLAWTAKFNGGSAHIDLDYPYDSAPSKPYLLEPTVDH
jgi:putative Flp pilus-assembly TadE/G-like protein